MDVSGAVIGERWRIGSTELEVCQPRQPCFKLGLAFGDPMMVRHFARAGRPGAYLRIIREGELGEGDRIEILARPAHGITIAVVGRAIVSDHAALVSAAAAPALAPDLAAWMRERGGPARVMTDEDARSLIAEAVRSLADPRARPRRRLSGRAAERRFSRPEAGAC